MTNTDHRSGECICSHNPIRQLQCSVILPDPENQENWLFILSYYGRHIGLIVSAFNSGASSPGALAGDFVLSSWARHFTLTVPLSTQVYKWVPASLMLGVTLRCTSISSRGEQKYSQLLHATETGISSGLMSHLAQMQTLPFTIKSCFVNTSEFYLVNGNLNKMSRVMRVLSSC